MNDDTFVKSYMENQAYKVASTHANEISGWKLYPDFYIHAPLILVLFPVYYTVTLRNLHVELRHNVTDKMPIL